MTDGGSIPPSSTDLPAGRDPSLALLDPPAAPFRPTGKAGPGYRPTTRMHRGCARGTVPPDNALVLRLRSSAGGGGPLLSRA